MQVITVLPEHSVVARVQGLGQFWQVPFWQNSLTGHGATGVLQMSQAAWLGSTMQVCVPLPLHCLAPRVQVTPHEPQAPPLQKVGHTSWACQLVQPLASATHSLRDLPSAAHWKVPAVQVPLHPAQLLLVQTLPALQFDWTHDVQPLESATQVSMLVPLRHLVVPALHVVVQEMQLPAWQVCP
jgi:hypothetical protein